MGQKPNVVWIIAEDLGTDLGCYGEKHVHTPNLDLLASQGALYTNAFMTSPVCSLARSGLITGMYPTSIDISAASLWAAGIQPPEELYDLRNDPHEICNLLSPAESGGKVAGAHEEVLQKMRRALNKWMVSTADMGATPDGPVPEGQSPLRSVKLS